MDVFNLHKEIISDYVDYVKSFIEIKDSRIHEYVEKEFDAGLLWPHPLIQINPSFASAGSIDDLVHEGILDPTCSQIFRTEKNENDTHGHPLYLYQHQADAIRTAQTGESYVLTTGTGSGKSLSYIIPIVDDILKTGSRRGIKAIIVYPMNALANSQQFELEKFLSYGSKEFPVTFERYTGQENDKKRDEIIAHPPDILLTNYVMLELILTRPRERGLVQAAKDLKFLVFDELHTYRGRQGADVGMLIRRLRNTLTPVGEKNYLQCIGTSATLAGPGTFAEQQKAVADLASKLFGTEVRPEHVIVETLKAETVNEINEDLTGQIFLDALRDDIETSKSSYNYTDFIRRPLCIWIERTLGLEKSAEGRLIRRRPKALEGKDGLAERLAKQTGLNRETCLNALKKTLLLGFQIKKPTGKPVFAFKLHQFLSKGDTVYATLESEETRSITLHGQKYAPDRSDARIPLFPLLFCRECGKEYYSVWKMNDTEKGLRFTPRKISGVESEESGIRGYLFLSGKDDEVLWPHDKNAQISLLPENWTEKDKKGNLRVKKNEKKYLPECYSIRADGSVCATGEEGCITAFFIPVPFLFCFACGVQYAPRSGEFSKLASLGSEGRSTATTIISMSTVSHLRQEKDLAETARKFLCFVDNRQDASLQAGHFNDFVETGLIRSALFNVLEKAGSDGLMHDTLANEVFKALGLGFPDKIFPRERYSAVPDAPTGRARNTDQSFLAVLSYRLYTDLRRGWRIVAPNLEQCGLLKIEYLDLEEICADDSRWERDPSLHTSSPKIRQDICELLLSFMRSRLCIDVDVLDEREQYRLSENSKHHLIEPWVLEDAKTLRHAGILYPRPRNSATDSRGDFTLTPKSALGRLIRRILSSDNVQPENDEFENTLHNLLKILSESGLLVETRRDKVPDTGYQLQASVMIWKAGDGTTIQHDPLHVRQTKGRTGRANTFFAALYRNAVKGGMDLVSREHTAQVPNALREEREEEFRKAALPVLFCSPTMELGVDIAQLNCVGMRNVPPTPANYAQRSGRAGRSGQPAIIITYCAQGSSHDQHFFRFPDEMVAGSVSTPRIDLANEDLIRAHVHALWIAEAGLDLHKSLKDLLDVSGQNPSLALGESVLKHLTNENARNTTVLRAQSMLEGIKDDLADCGWYSENWIRETVDNIPGQFEEACERWRNLYRSALHQSEIQNRIANDALRSQNEHELARKLWREAGAQMDLLLCNSSSPASDFYSYRYFACEGFLPGYNFPRLPLTAFIPSPVSQEKNGYISRARFLAISEFGPGSIIYHEGARYVISRVIMDIQDDETHSTSCLKLCESCGYVHVIHQGEGPDLCELCGTRLTRVYSHMFRMRNVITHRRDRISSDEEERQRFGYILRSGFRFVEHGSSVSHRDARVHDAQGNILFKLQYGHGADLWRFNFGWLNRSKDLPDGFLLNTEKGIWVKDSKECLREAEEGMADPTGKEHVERVIPYVQDRKNCLRIVPDPLLQLDSSQFHSLQEAIKQAILQIYQLEDFEISAETIPSVGEPNSILLIESAEGGAGVLRRLVDDSSAMQNIARKALEICHFDPVTGKDLEKAPHATEKCIVACYDCLLNYNNQRFHDELNRHSIKDLLLRLANKTDTQAAPKAVSRTERFTEMLGLCDSELEKKWLTFVFEKGYRLPDRTQYLINACETCADFFYAPNVAIYIDGPVHDYEDRIKRDREQEDCLEDYGFVTFRFADWEQWQITLDQHPDIFGNKK